MRASVTLEIIESFLAVKAAIHGLAGCGSKLADQFCVIGIAPRTCHCFLAKHFGCAKLLLWIRGCNAKGF